MRPSIKTRTSLLGIPRENAGPNSNEIENQDLMESQNDEALEELSRTTGRIKDIAIDMKKNADLSTRYLDDMGSAAGGLQALFSGTFDRFQSMQQTGGFKQMIKLAFILVCVFIFLYFIFLFASKNRDNEASAKKVGQNHYESS